MSQLKLAASKIPIELMERLNRLTELTGLTQSAAIRQAIEFYLDNAELTGLSKLTAIEGNLTHSQPVTTDNSVNSRLTDIEARLAALESRSLMTTVKPIAIVTNSPNTTSQTPPIATVTKKAPAPTSPPPPNGKPLADGGQWLSTSEAFEMARKRGCKHDKKTTFSKFAKAHPDRLDVWGLRYLGANNPGDQRTASFQDLRFEG